MIWPLFERLRPGRHRRQRYLPDFDVSADAAAIWRNASRPRFFFAADAVAELWQRVDPARRQQLAAAADADYRIGLPVYTETAPPLAADFPWHGGWTRKRDPLYRNRPHRFGFLIRHCVLIATGDGDADRLTAVLDGWMAFAGSNDRSAGLAYTSTLLVEQRLFAVHWGIHLLLGGDRRAAAQPLVERLSRILAADVAYLLPRLGRSVANNHLLADRFTGWYLHAMLPELVGDGVDARTMEHAWLTELERQTYDDGTGFEHSTHYHEFGCEAGLAWLLLSRANGWRAAPGSAARIERMLDFQAALCGAAGVPKRIGNATEDPLIGFDAGEGVSTGALREAYRRLFSPDLRRTRATAPAIEKAVFMTARAGFDDRDADAASAILRHWPDGGYVQLALRDGYRLLLRTGPAQGRPVFPGHLHADLLSLHIDRDGEPIAGDGGTCTYRMKGDTVDDVPARAYFEAPGAHSGPVVEGGHPFGELLQDFRSSLPELHVETRIDEQRACIRVDNRIVGGGPFADWRRTVWQVRSDYWLIVDEPGAAATAGRRCFSQLLMAPGVRVSRAQSGSQQQPTLLLSKDGGAPSLLLSTLPVVEVAEGLVSQRYGDCVPTLKMRLPNTDSPTVWLLHTARPDHDMPRIDWQPARRTVYVDYGDRRDEFHIEAG